MAEAGCGVTQSVYKQWVSVSPLCRFVNYVKMTIADNDHHQIPSGVSIRMLQLITPNRSFRFWGYSVYILLIYMKIAYTLQCIIYHKTPGHDEQC